MPSARTGIFTPGAITRSAHLATVPSAQTAVQDLWIAVRRRCGYRFPRALLRRSLTEGVSAFAIGSDGKLYAWGENIYGSLGNGTTGNSYTPVLVSLPSGVTAKAIAGGATAYTIGSDGNLYAWGHNDEGQLAGVSGLSPLPDFWRCRKFL